MQLAFLRFRVSMELASEKVSALFAQAFWWALVIAIAVVAWAAFNTDASAHSRHHYRHHWHHAATNYFQLNDVMAHRETRRIHRSAGSEGRRVRRVTYSRRGGGACDGFQRCRCGVTAAHNFGIPYAFKGFNLKLAWEWTRAFPHTSFHPGVAGVKPHHVLQVVGGPNCANATVRDERGTYQRNVCGMTFVAVGGGA